MAIKTRFFIISDTHGAAFETKEAQQADVAIHCGDLTEESKITEIHAALQFLKSLKARKKLVIAGNHDFTLDVPTFKTNLAEAGLLQEEYLIKQEFGEYGEARRLFNEAAKDGIVFLDEGTHDIDLENGARLRVYASPYTPGDRSWGFSYPPKSNQNFSIDQAVDVVITHGPPAGIFDRNSDKEKRLGCESLFSAVAQAKPRLHCFGHVHGGWGARFVTWKDQLGDSPSHFTAIDNSRSITLEKLANLVPTARENDMREVRERKAAKLNSYLRDGFCSTSHCAGDERPIQHGAQTLFVNAAIEGLSGTLPIQPPWLVDIELDSILDT
ncbi:ser/Thr protein phosphatase family protein [Hypoxylon sp. NC1633]|nr:ser/Thr protein phosphatase family protein [Hypoxylon sp. NC1633]